jgi:hypothetical protein
MKNVPFAAIRMHFPDEDSVTLDELFQWIGYPENIHNPNFENTCAIRMSLALLGAGFPNPGIYPVKAGQFKGRAIETKQRKLSNWLVHQLGQPEKYNDGQEAQKKIGARHGIISFFHLHGPTDNQGHIAIVALDRWQTFRCGTEKDSSPTGCFWGAVEVWFWPLR